MQEFTYRLRCVDNSWNDTFLKKWVDLICKGAEKLGLEWGQTAKYPQLMKEKGFENVKCETFFWPTNS